jgi:hypothetical protein
VDNIQQHLQNKDLFMFGESVSLEQSEFQK